MSIDPNTDAHPIYYDDPLFSQNSPTIETNSPRGWNQHSTIEHLSQRNEAADSGCCSNCFYNALHWIVYILTFTIVNLFPQKNKEVTFEHPDHSVTICELTENTSRIPDYTFTQNLMNSSITMSCPADSQRIPQPVTSTVSPEIKDLKLSEAPQLYRAELQDFIRMRSEFKKLPEFLKPLVLFLVCPSAPLGLTSFLLSNLDTEEQHELEIVEQGPRKFALMMLSNHDELKCFAERAKNFKALPLTQEMSFPDLLESLPNSSIEETVFSVLNPALSTQENMQEYASKLCKEQLYLIYPYLNPDQFAHIYSFLEQKQLYEEISQHLINELDPPSRSIQFLIDKIQWIEPLLPENEYNLLENENPFKNCSIKNSDLFKNMLKMFFEQPEMNQKANFLSCMQNLQPQTPKILSRASIISQTQANWALTAKL